MNTISFIEQENTSPSLNLESENRHFTFPFLFVTRAKKNGVFYPSFENVPEIDSMQFFNKFSILIKDIDNNLLFKTEIDTLVQLDTTNKLSSLNYQISKICISSDINDFSNIFLSYKLTLTDFKGNQKETIIDDQKFQKETDKRFGSFF